ncbi:MAG: AAA family ATPase, partial [Solirubrobacterales bacterium]|nr:AAA family ATPase [Solirubrobacterales bacterium]
MVERDRELAEIAAAIDAARAGAGGVAVVEAAAGLGKTRLLQAARDRAHGAGMAVLAARGSELERGFPFGVARQLLEPPLAALDARERERLLAGAAAAARGALGLDRDGRAADADDSFAVLHGLYWLVAGLAERGPLLLVVDDAHWADSASLDFLAFLATRLDELAVLLALGCRPAEVDAGGPLARIAADPSARSLEPRPLAVAGAAALLAAEVGEPPDEPFAAACHEVSAGNPFLLCELARTVVAERIEPVASEADRVRELAPDRVVRTVQLRLARLSPAARDVARAVVV